MSTTNSKPSLFDTLHFIGSGPMQPETSNGPGQSPAHMRNVFTRSEPVPTLGECAPASPRPLSLDNAALDPSCVGLPLLYVSSGGTISVVLAQEIVVEITTDRTVRVVSHDQKWAIASDPRGVHSALLLPGVRLYKHDDKVDCVFDCISKPTEKKIAVIGPQGVLFTMSSIKEAYLVSSSLVKGTSTMPTDNIRFPDLQKDLTLDLFYGHSKNGSMLVPLCNDIVKAAHYERKPDGSIDLVINGLSIHQRADGTVELDGRSLHIECSPSTGAMGIRTHAADGKSYVKQGAKRVHVSRSGMLASDGNYIASMDHTGRIVSCI